MELPAYQLIRAKRRSVAIHLRAGQIEVRAPLKLAQREIDAFVASRADWIAKHLAESIVPDVWQPGLGFELLGQRWQLQFRPYAGRARLQADGLQRILWLEARTWQGELARRLFLRWLTSLAKEKLVPALHERARQMGDSERLKGTVLRHTKSMWGRCSARGEILLNPALLLTEQRCIDYLLVHELAHLRHMNHSPAFWQRVAEYCPHWQQSRKALKAYSLHWLQQPASSAAA